MYPIFEYTSDLTVIFMNLYHMAIISGLKDGHTLTQYPEKIVIFGSSEC